MYFKERVQKFPSMDEFKVVDLLQINKHGGFCSIGVFTVTFATMENSNKLEIGLAVVPTFGWIIDFDQARSRVSFAGPGQLTL